MARRWAWLRLGPAGEGEGEESVVEEEAGRALLIHEHRPGGKTIQLGRPYDSVGGPAEEESGEVYGGSLEWPGSFQMAAEVDTRNRARLRRPQLGSKKYISAAPTPAPIRNVLRIRHLL